MLGEFGNPTGRYGFLGNMLVSLWSDLMEQKS